VRQSGARSRDGDASMRMDRLAGRPTRPVAATRKRRIAVPTFDVSSAGPADVKADLLVLPFFAGRVAGPGVVEVQSALGGDLMAAARQHGLSGKLGETLAVPTLGRLPAASVLLVGLGDAAKAGPGEVRKAAMRSAARGGRFATVATTLHQVGGDATESAHALAEGFTLGSYKFTKYKRAPSEDGSKESRLARVLLIGDGGEGGAVARRGVKAALKRGQVYADAANWARDLINTPSIDATPEYLASEAQKMAKASGLECKVWTKADLKKGGFGGILGVGSGSANEPRFVELMYKGAGNARPIAVTGKGITFDSGGLSIKQAEWMETMKDDMSGAAATMALMRAIATLKPKVNVIAAIPFAENMPSGSAIRPGDVLHHRGGKTSEVLNTDAEGRLVLADALAYLAEKKPRVLIDSATLTGAAMVALGPEVWAVMGSDDDLIRDLLAAGEAAGEPGWQLPLWQGYRRHIESSVADVKNVGIRYGGAITAGLFLKEFTGDIPWAHMDVAGPAFVDGASASEWFGRGGTGIPVRTLLRYVEGQAARGSRPRS
jgi:leucyl aminopeptidase